ncbi:MAG TPA: asparagine synthase (glutamine-hydrolyzing) [Thermoanaerobaculia bacterium]|nr:asparagine synthase (glutamine-hydrolyzing) [Thermoanaerobaculia bacterium]
MCGIYGMISLTGEPLRHPDVIEQMGGSLRHRGPDGHEVLRSTDALIGTERLRIIDLNPRADQPFSTPDDSVWLACNGEIYNSIFLREAASDYPFRSHSDVEPLLPLYLRKGKDLVSDLDGMFGLALWDRRTRTLLLARDRAGEKPLFYLEIGNEIWFASEIQALLTHPDSSRALDPESVDEFLALGLISEPRTIFRAIKRVDAGTLATFRGADRSIHRYWDPSQFQPTIVEPKTARVEMVRLVENAVAKQIAADVPIGVFVSGGIDSSILASLAARQLGPSRVHTISVEFTEASYDESGDAAEFAKGLGSHHVDVRADEASLREAFDQVNDRIAEPIADPAVLPAFLLARKAREHVTVVLSGEGADELFGGYPTYLGHALAPRFNGLPRLVRQGLIGAAGLLPSSTKKVPLEFLLKRFTDEAGRPWMERHLRWIGTRLAPESWAVTGGASQKFRAEIPAALDAVTGAMLLDYKTYLRDNLLVKVDRACMLSSIEARAPYLDRELTAFGLSLAPSLRVRGLTSKWLLKSAAEEWISPAIIRRRKRGLSVPIAGWINHGLRAEVDRLLDSSSIETSGFIDPGVVSRLLGEHRAGTANHARSLWPIIVLQRWTERWTKTSARAS